MCAIIELNGQICAIFKAIAQSFPPGIQTQLLNATLKATPRHETKVSLLSHAEGLPSWHSLLDWTTFLQFGTIPRS